jgi:hypothetical protein
MRFEFAPEDVDRVMAMSTADGKRELIDRGYTTADLKCALGMWVLLERDRDHRRNTEAKLRWWLRAIRRRSHEYNSVSTYRSVVHAMLRAALRGDDPPGWKR